MFSCRNERDRRPRLLDVQPLAEGGVDQQPQVLPQAVGRRRGRGEPQDGNSRSSKQVKCQLLLSLLTNEFDLGLLFFIKTQWTDLCF